MASKFFFGGRLHTTPIAVSEVDDTRMSPRNPAVGNNLAILGIADAGEPNKALAFSTPRDAARVLRKGELLTGVRKGFSPSAATGGPAKVFAIRVGKPTRSTLTLKDGATTPADSIVLTSEPFGLYANQIRVSVENGSLSGKRLTTREGNTYYTADNVGRGAFTVRYSGAEATATIDVTNTQVVLTAGATIATLPLASAPTVQQLVDQINARPGFTAAAVPGSAFHPTVAALDGYTAQDVKTAVFTVRADLAACIDWFNSSAELLVTAARASGATRPPANTPLTFLAGATAPAVVLQDWLDAIDVLTALDVQHIVALSPSEAVHSALDAHCLFMSDAGRKERRAYHGPALGLTVDQVSLLPKALNSDRSALVWPGHYDTDLDTGLRVLLPPYMTAVHIAGGFSGQNPGNAMTNKAIGVKGLEYDPSFPAETDTLIDAGVLTFENTPRGYVVARSISTWLQNDNYNRVEISCGIATDYVVRAVREALQPLVGNKASPQILGLAAQITEATLKALARPEPGGPGVIVGDQNSPAYQNILCEIDGDILYVSFECSPVIPLNFVGLSVSVVPYRGTVRA